MTLRPEALAAILLLAVITYGCRIGGVLVASRYDRAGRARAAFDAIPAAVLTAVIAPMVLTTGWPETIAAGLTALAAWRLPLLATVALGVAAVVLLRAGL